ncbi:MAG: PaaI family thioesterase [Pyrinomonadaceae bacterium]|nr:PaaI family thioesterase [Pyrinomonadaceae bacterium]
MADSLSITEEQKQRAKNVLDNMPFARLIGMTLDHLELDTATVRLEMRDELRQPGGLLHGGVTATLIDTAMAFAVRTRVADDEHTATIDLTVHYIRPHINVPAFCTAKVVRAGKRIFTVSAEMTNEEGKLTATAISTYTRL